MSLSLCRVSAVDNGDCIRGLGALICTTSLPIQDGFSAACSPALNYPCLFSLLFPTCPRPVSTPREW